MNMILPVYFKKVGCKDPWVFGLYILAMQESSYILAAFPIRESVLRSALINYLRKLRCLVS